jgi:thiol-disulfide isomerase/thioredoxin
MSKLTQIVSNYLNPKKPMIWMIILIVLFIVASVYGYKKYFLPWLQSRKDGDVTNVNPKKGGESGGGEVKIYFFFANWCPHCKTAKPEWEQFSKNYNHKEIGNYTILCIQMDCTEDPPKPEIADMIKKYDIQGYPTIKMVKDGKVIDFDAKVTNSALEQFVKNMVA